MQVTSDEHIRELTAYVDLAMDDGSATWHLGENGSWTRHHLDADGEPLADVQDTTMSLIQRRRRSRQARR